MVRHSRFFFAKLVGLAIVLVVLLLFSLGLGSVHLSLQQIVQALLAGVSGRSGAGDTNWQFTAIVWDFRLARSLLAMCVGAALAASGAAFQGLFRNPLADPFVIGASSGAALGATLAIILQLPLSLGGFGPVPLAAFAGSLLTVLLVYTISHTGGNAPPAVALLLAGTALSSLLSAMVSLLMALRDQKLYQIFFWLLGGLGGKSWPQLAAMLPYLGTSIILLSVLARPLDIMAFGDETARGMGLAVKQARLLIVVAASLATAAAVATAGIIGFIGLVAPHIARLLFGPSHRRLLASSALIGAILLLTADGLARTILAPVELPVGILTAILGAPFFLYLLRTRQKALGGN